VFPLPGDDLLGLVAAHTLHPPRPFEESDPRGRVPPGVRAVVLRSLAKKPPERFASARAMSEALEVAAGGAAHADLLPLLRGSEVVARRRARGAAIWAGRRRLLVATCGLAAIAVAPAFAPALATVLADRVLRVDRAALVDYLPVASYGRPGNGPGELNRPVMAARSPFGEVLIASADSSRVDRFAERGGYRGTIGGFGSDPGEFLWPVDVAVHADGSILVSDQRNDRVQLFSRDGELIGIYRDRGSKDDPIRYPQGAAFHPDGSFSVLEVGLETPRITRLTRKGTLVRSWSIAGPYTTALDVDQEGDVWVAGPSGVRRFAPSGALRAEWPLPADAGAPLSIEVDGDGRVLVSTNRHQLLILSPGGELLGRFGKRGSGRGEFDLPAGVAVGPRGDVFVAEENNNRVQRLVPPPHLQVWTGATPTTPSPRSPGRAPGA
jgi:DNA-binding beta-propeller fold protein YncE